MKRRFTSVWPLASALAASLAPSACSSVPSDVPAATTSSVSAAFTPEMPIAPTHYTFTLSRVIVDQANEVSGDLESYDNGFVEWGELAAHVASKNPVASPTNQYQTGCVLGPAWTGAVLGPCTAGPGPGAQTGPFDQGKALHADVWVVDPDDKVYVGVALDNIESASPSGSNLGSMIADGLQAVGGGAQLEATLSGVTASLAQGQPLAAALGPVGAAVAIVGSVLAVLADNSTAAGGISGGDGQLYTCAGGLIGPKPGNAWSKTFLDTGVGFSTPNTTDVAQLAPGTAPRPEGAPNYFTPADLAFLTAYGPVDLEMDVATPGGVAAEGDGVTHALSCSTRHRLFITVARDSATGNAPSAKAGDFATAQSANHVDGFWIDQRTAHATAVEWIGRSGDAGWQSSFAATNLSLAADTPIASVSRAPGYVDAFWVDEHGALATAYSNPAHPVASYASGLPADALPPRANLVATARTPGSIDLFYIGTDGAVHRTYWSTPLGWKTAAITAANIAPAGGGVAAVARIESNLDVFFIGNDGAMNTAFWYEGGKWASFSIPGAAVAPKGAKVTAIARDAMTLDAFVSGSTGAVYQSHWDSKSWTTGAITPPAAPARVGAALSAAVRPDGSVELAYVDGSIVRRLSSASGRPPFTASDVGVSTAAAGSISVVARSNDDLDIFYRDTSGRPSIAQFVPASQSWLNHPLLEPALGVAAPVVTSIGQSSGALAGGTRLDLTGSGFDANVNTDHNMRVFFGTTPTTNIVCSNTTICTVWSPPSAALGPVHVTVSTAGGTSAASSADVFTYRAQPAIARFGWSNDIADIGFVEIDGSAPAGGAIVTLTSSNPNAVTVPATVTIPAGSLGAEFVVTMVPTPTRGTATLVATYAGSSMSTPVAYAAWPALVLHPGAASLNAGESTTLTASLSTVAPAGGAVVALTSSMPSAVAVPATVTVPAGQHTTTIAITNAYSGTSKNMTLTARYKGAQSSAVLRVPTAPCKTRTCTRGTLFNPDTCSCEVP